MHGPRVSELVYLRCKVCNTDVHQLCKDPAQCPMGKAAIERAQERDRTDTVTLELPGALRVKLRRKRRFR